MQIFEFHFNPKKRKQIVNTFCYEPKEPEPKKEGYLYMAGELLNLLPGSEQFLNNLAKIIKEEYYSEFHTSFDNSIKKSLSRANNYLSSQISKNNVSWLGNINFAIVALCGKNTISVSKIGNASVLMIKNEKIIDITKKTNPLSQPFNQLSYSPKAFSNLYSGKIDKGDKVIILTKEIFELFQKLSILDEISKISHIEKESLEKLIEDKKNNLVNASGALILIETLKEKEEVESNEVQEVNFSFKNIILPIKNKINLYFFKKIKKINLLKTKNKKETKNKRILKIKNKIKPINFSFFSDERFRKTLFLIILLFFLLALGSRIFNDSEKQTDKIQAELLLIEEEIEKAKKLIENNQENQAFLALKEIYKKTDENKNFEEYKEKAEFYLNKISNIKIIDDPDLVYRFNPKDLAPQRILFFNQKLYFFTPFSNKIVELDANSKESKEYFLPSDKNKGPSSGRIVGNKPVFFLKPDSLFSIENSEVKIIGSMKNPDFDYDFSHFSVFWASLYFWNPENGEIIRYKDYTSSPEKWINDNEKKPTDILSMSVDGVIWVLNKDNSIWKYSKGKLIEEISLSIFPFLKKPSQIYTSPSFSYLYILEPMQNRIIVANKQGEIISQFQSEKFNNLISFSISQNENELYLLNNLEVYKINLH